MTLKIWLSSYSIKYSSPKPRASISRSGSGSRIQIIDTLHLASRVRISILKSSGTPNPCSSEKTRGSHRTFEHLFSRKVKRRLMTLRLGDSKSGRLTQEISAFKTWMSTVYRRYILNRPYYWPKRSFWLLLEKLILVKFQRSAGYWSRGITTTPQTNRSEWSFRRMKSRKIGPMST